MPSDSKKLRKLIREGKIAEAQAYLIAESKKAKMDPDRFTTKPDGSVVYKRERRIVEEDEKGNWRYKVKDTPT
jgi:hypothetical protein